MSIASILKTALVRLLPVEPAIAVLPPGYAVRPISRGAIEWAVDHPSGWSSYHFTHEDAVRHAWASFQTK